MSLQAAGNDSFASKLMSLQAADSFGSRTGVAVTAVVKRENDQTGNSQDWEASYCTETPDSDVYPSAEGQFFDSDDSSFDWFEHVLITIQLYLYMRSLPSHLYFLVINWLTRTCLY